MRITVIVYPVLLVLFLQGCADPKEQNPSSGENDMKQKEGKKQQIGVATMKPDGTIIIYMGFKGTLGEMVDGFAEFKPDNPDYQDIIKRLGGIKPGESKAYFKP